MSVVSLASGMACSLANMGAWDGCLASRVCCLAAVDEGAAGTGFLIGDTVGVGRLKSSVRLIVSGDTWGAVLPYEAERSMVTGLSNLEAPLRRRRTR